MSETVYRRKEGGLQKWNGTNGAGAVVCKRFFSLFICGSSSSFSSQLRTVGFTRVFFWRPPSSSLQNVKSSASLSCVLGSATEDEASFAAPERTAAAARIGSGLPSLLRDKCTDVLERRRGERSEASTRFPQAGRLCGGRGNAAARLLGCECVL